MSGGFEAVLVGDDAVDAMTKVAEERIRQGLASGIFLAANNIMTEAKERAPLDIGTLRGSGYVTLPETHGAEVVVELGFGGPAASYAVVQHERTELNHDVGEAKFLEKAVANQQQDAISLTMKVVAASMEGASVSTTKAHPTAPDAS